MSYRMIQPLARERLYLSSDVGVRKSKLMTKFPTWDYSEIVTDDAWWFTSGGGEAG
jgi:hypothetical protein